MSFTLPFEPCHQSCKARQAWSGVGAVPAGHLLYDDVLCHVRPRRIVAPSEVGKVTCSELASYTTSVCMSGKDQCCRRGSNGKQ